MKPNETSRARALAVAAALSAALAACSSAPQRAAAEPQVAAAQEPHCKTTRNLQSRGPQPALHPPRCADSLDAGKLPATAIPPILVGH